MGSLFHLYGVIHFLSMTCHVVSSSPSSLLMLHCCVCTEKVQVQLVSAHIMVSCRLPRMAGQASIADGAAADAEEIEEERPGRGRATTRSPVIAPALPSNSEESHSTVRSSQV